MSTPGPPVHLVRRFFGMLGARPLGPPDQAFAAALTSADERRLFFAQHPADQRHAVDGARLVLGAAPGRADLAHAILLHDVGKRHASLGIVGRSLASIAALVRIPTAGRWAAYLSHGESGAADLTEAGSAGLAVTFARRHHGRRRPAAITPEDWALLRAADEV